MAAPTPIPVANLVADDFLQSVRDNPGRLVYFLLNVGDGDAQAILLPADEDTGFRRAIVVDAGRVGKVPGLLDMLVQEGILPPVNSPQEPGSIPLVIATHPHGDHINGMEDILQQYPARISEFWDPGYYHTTGAYQNMMRELELNSHIDYAQPTSGHRKWIGDAVLTVLSPSIHLRNRFDTYGIDINNSSIAVRVEFPAARVIQRGVDRVLVDSPSTASLVLGADAHTLSWSFAFTEFPHLHTANNAAARAIGAATGQDLMRGHVLKVSHHCSKHGVNLELAERIPPASP